MLTFIAISKVTGGLLQYHEQRDSSAIKTWQFRVFCCLWAIATLFHMAHSDLFSLRFHYVLLTLAAAWAIVKPSLRAFLVLISLQLADVVYTMPATSNHWLFTSFVNVTIIQALLYNVIKNKSFRVTEDRLLETFMPVVRIELLVLYFYAVFHKLNAGFFTPASSCATVLLEAQHLEAIIPSSPGISTANIYFTLLVESAIPIFLCFRKTRHWGILIGLTFHCILGYSSYNAFFDFSSMVFAVYFLFSSPVFCAMLLNVGRKFRAKLLNNGPGAYAPKRLVLLTGLWLAGLLTIVLLTKNQSIAASHYFYTCWTVYSLVYIGLLVWFMLADNREPAGKTASLSFSVPHPFFLIVPVIVFLNGLSPYLGLKTENSFAMFSNLRTEGNVSNHYILPASFQVFDFQKDMVEIVSSSDPYLHSLAATNKIMVFFDFKNYVAQFRPEQVEYIRNGQRQEFLLQSASPNDELLTKDLILRKLLRFRTISRNEPQPCSH